MERSPFRRFGKLSKYLVWIFIVVAGQNIKLVTAQSPSEKVELRPVEIQLLRDSLVGNQNLSENELEDFKVNVENKINEFQNDLTIIASKEVVEADRCLAIETALKLFIANAQMQVSNVKGGSKFYPIKK